MAKIKIKQIDNSTANSGDVITYNGTNNVWSPDIGEANTSSNVGVAGVGVFKQKTGVDFEFKNINAGSTKITITDDVANNEIDIDVDLSQINLDDLNDVNVTSVINGQVLIYNNTSGNWEASTPDPDGIIIEETNVSVVANALTVNFAGNVTVTDAGAGQADVNVGGTNGLLGGLHQMSFLEHSSVKNKWLGYYDGEIPSSHTFGEMPWKSKLVGITFSNKYDGADTDIKIYSTPEGGGVTPKTLDFTWSLTDKRIARKTNITPDVIFDAGDKVAIYLKEPIGGNKDPKNPVIVLYLQIIDDTLGESGENFSGNYATGTGGGSS